MNANHTIAGAALRLMFLGQVVAVIGMVVGLIPIVGAIGGLATLVGSIMALVGLIKAGPAHENYRKALWMIIGSIIVTVLATFLAGAAIVGGSGGMLLLVVLVLPVAISVMGLLQVFFSCSATSALVRETGNEAVAAKGDTVFKLNAICYGAGIVLAILVFVSPGLAAIGGLVSSIVSIVAAVIYLIFLKESSELLSA